MNDYSPKHSDTGAGKESFLESEAWAKIFCAICIVGTFLCLYLQTHVSTSVAYEGQTVMMASGPLGGSPAYVPTPAPSVAIVEPAITR